MSFSVCILTGGQSSRMGADKSQLYFKGETLINSLIKLANKISDDVFVAGHCVNTDHPTTFHEDRQVDRGPLSGILTALTHCKNDWVLILACDMLLFDQKTMSWLTNEFEKLTSEKIAFAANEKDHYLVGFYHKSLANQVSEILQTDDLSVRQLVVNNISRRLVLPNEIKDSISNFNSTKDLDTFGWMKVKIITFGRIEEILGKNELDWITESTDITGLKEELLDKFPKLKDQTFRFAHNETLVDNALLAMNDTIALLPPFAGG